MTRRSDIEWPPIPYSQFLRERLDACTQYEYINPSLDRRYDPVVVGGNAMHPVIQRDDVVLIDTGMKQPEDGRAVAVRLEGGRKTVIGYWRSREGKPVLEQEATSEVIDLAKYPDWAIYGVVTKVVGRTIPAHPPASDVALGTEEARMDLTPGQAHWVIERLVADRRVSRQDVDRYVGDMSREIAEIEQRLASLRETAGKPSAASPAPRTAVAPGKARKRRAAGNRGKKGHPRGIAGTLAVLLRSIPAAEHAAIQAIRESKGIKAAIAEARKAAKR